VKLHPAYDALKAALFEKTGSDSTIINDASTNDAFKVRRRV